MANPCSQLSGLGNRFQSLPGMLRQLLAGIEEEIGVSGIGPAPHPTAQLVQLRQPQFIGAIDNQGIDIGHIQAGLYNSGGDQNIIFTGHKNPP